MKKILFATTALVATAGVAAADVTITGRASFGLLYTESAGVSNSQLRSSADLYFTGTTETDGGVSLSATVELEGLGYNGGNANVAPAVGYANGTNVGATTVFSASAGGLTFTYGNTDSAFDRNMGEVHRISGIYYELWGGLGGLDDGSLFIDNDDNGMTARVDYASGPFQVSLSYSGIDDSFGIGARYTGEAGSGSYYIGAGYEDKDGMGLFPTQGSYYGLSAGGTFGAFEARVAMMDGDNLADPVFNLSAAYSANGLMVGANYLFTDTAGRDDQWTIFTTYDLGGGATLFAQYGERATNATFATQMETATMGVNFSF